MLQYIYTERVRAVNNETSIKKKQINRDKVLFLGYGEESTNLIQFLRESGFEVTHENEILKTEDGSGFDLLVSYGYRHKIPMNFLDSVQGPKLNLHISYLPWNKGSHPVFWAFFESTPLGVTIHELDAGIDTGGIYAIRELVMDPKFESFSSAYDTFRQEIEDLFMEVLPKILSGQLKPTPQTEAGTNHRSSQIPEEFKGWDSNIFDEVARLKGIDSNKNLGNKPNRNCLTDIQ
jgi:folate-dependent phosphoribosylglycinamide formyltransferase PurN